MKTLLPRYISREFWINFLLSFFFFFFIFFINQLLVMLGRDEVKNLSIKVIIELILLSTPQFLTYTFPFSSLTSTAMVVGDLSSKNEIMALRSLGISLKRMFLPLIIASSIAGVGTYIIADVVNPWASGQYKRVFAQIIHDMPTTAIKPNSTTTINNITISVGEVNGTHIKNIRILDNSSAKQSLLITAENGDLVESKDSRYVYTLSLAAPEIMITSNSNINEWTIAECNNLVYTLDMTSLLPAFAEPTPTQVRNKELVAVIKEETISNKSSRISDLTSSINYINDSVRGLYDIVTTLSLNSAISDIQEYSKQRDYAKSEYENKSFSYRKMYFESEFHKRFVLSFGCILLAFLAFSISFFKVKNGRLIGFALSMVIAVIYWCLLYVAQLNSISKFNPYFSVAFIMWLTNIIFAVIGVLVFAILRRS